ncbi:MAG: glycosyl hydrolase 53 family protein [Bacteroidetes bacterium]|nr:glycosyl hydrolase 53 family protein [Bacteroidota bacterium]
MRTFIITTLFYFITFQCFSQQPTLQDTLLDYITGRWVLRGNIAGQATVHDISAEWVLNHQFVLIRETSHEKNAKGEPEYQANVYVGWDQASSEYICIWLDIWGGFTPQSVGRAKREGDSIPFLFRKNDNTTDFHTTFVYDKKTGTWQWKMDNDYGGKLQAFARVTLSRYYSPKMQVSEFASVSQVANGKPVSVMLTSYSTTLLANGRDHAKLRIALIDSISREITSANDSIRIYVTGDGKVTASDGSDLLMRTDTAGTLYSACKLVNGTCRMLFIAGNKPGKVKVEAHSGKLWPGSHEIHTLPADFAMMKPKADQLSPTTKPIDRMIGADISFLPEIEARGSKFLDNGQEKDAIMLLKDHGFNYIRLRIFVNPENQKGYSPGKGFCDLKHTLDMAQRIHDAGMKLLLDFHYSDYWADPQQQFKPEAWANLDFNTLMDSVKTYTSKVLMALKQQGTMPAMVQVGNEINHGILWPDGHIGNPDQLAGLLKAGVAGVESVDPAIPVMMHLALGGQNEEAVFWLDNMIARGVRFDIIGLSYYPRWHGTLDDLQNNLNDLRNRYNKPLNVAEYSDFKPQVHDIIFSLPEGMGKGACIWEPLNSWSGLFDRNGATTKLIQVYDEMNSKYFTTVK